ncbi:hypothetical protein WME91_39640 [Sorangium sp. So ce269]
MNPSLTITAMAERAMSKLPRKQDNPAFAGSRTERPSLPAGSAVPPPGASRRPETV